MTPLINLFSPTRFVSMRVHGTSAQVQFPTPDDERKIISVERLSTGTLVTSNYVTDVSVHFSIPTPLTVETTLGASLRRLGRGLDIGLETRGTESVFEDTAVRVARIEVYLGVAKINFGSIEVMDGNRKIAEAQIDLLPEIAVNMDKYYEEPPPVTPNKVIKYELNQRVYTALGVTLNGGFRGFDSDFRGNQLHLIAAKAIFFTRGI